jgi:hypothetical protein
MTTRHDVEFTSADAVCRAWLYIPQSPDPRPIILMRTDSAASGR